MLVGIAGFWGGVMGGMYSFQKSVIEPIRMCEYAVEPHLVLEETIAHMNPIQALNHQLSSNWYIPLSLTCHQAVMLQRPRLRPVRPHLLCAVLSHPIQYRLSTSYSFP